MKLKPIQSSILTVQIAALALNLYAIFIKRVQDSGGHWIGTFLILTIMALSLKSWHEVNEKTAA